MTQEHVHESSVGVGPFMGPPKTMFFLGFFVGIAICTTAILAFVVWSISSGRGIALAAGNEVLRGNDQEAAGQVVANQPTEPQAPSAPVQPVDEKTDHVKGSKNAKVTLIEYSDFECPYCAKHFATIEQLMKDYPNDVRLVFRHYPLSFHEFAQKLAEASECVAELGGNDAFFKYHDKVFQTMEGGNFTQDKIVGLAKEIGMDEAKMKTCVDSGKYAAKVANQMELGAQAGVQGTPGTFINGKLVEGAVPLSVFKTEIEAILKK